MAGFNMSVKASAFRKIGGFRIDLTLGEDIDLAQRLRKVGRVEIDTNFCVYSSGRRFRNGLLMGIATYAPSYFMRVVFKKEKFLTFNPVRSEKSSQSNFNHIPLALTTVFIAVLFYLASLRDPKF